VAYDGAGAVTSVKNTVAGTELKLTFAPDGRLVSAVTPEGNLVEYLYDGLGQRVVRKVDGVVDRKYIYDDAYLLHAILDKSDKVDTRFEYAGGMLPVRMIRSGTTYYMGFDLHGSLRLVANAQGTVVQRLDYDAWGNVTSMLDPDFDAVFGFGTGTTDNLTGLVRIGVRDYLPLLGRWLVRDPVGPEVSFNPYTFAANDPASASDQNGLWEVGLGLFGGIGGKLKIGYKNGTFWWDSCVGAGVGADISLDVTKGPPLNLSRPGFDSQLFAELEGKANFGIFGSIGGNLRAKEPKPCNGDFLDLSVGAKLFNAPMGKYSHKWNEDGTSTGKYDPINPLIKDFLVPTLDKDTFKPGLPAHYKMFQDIAKDPTKAFKVSGTANACAGATGVWRIW
jgi:RHS repeat-associated protein